MTFKDFKKTGQEEIKNMLQDLETTNANRQHGNKFKTRRTQGIKTSNKGKLL